MRASAAEERRGAGRGTAVAGESDVGVGFVSVAAGREEYLKEEEDEEASGHGGSSAFPSAHYQTGKPGWNPDDGEMFGNHGPGLNVLLLDEQRFAPARFPHALRVAGMIVPAAADADTDDREDDIVTEVVGRPGGGGGGAGYTAVAGNGGAKRKGWWEADVTDGGGTLYNENERIFPLGPALPPNTTTTTTTPTLTTLPTTTTTTRPMNAAPNGGMRLPSHSFSRNVDLGGIARNLRSDQSQWRGYQQVQVQVQEQGQTHAPRSGTSRGGLGGEHERGISRTMILASEGEGDDPCELSAPLHVLCSCL